MSFFIEGLTPQGRKFFKELEKLGNLQVHVGFQGDETYEDGTSLAEIAAFNELGTSTIPARPFMKQSFKDHEKDLKETCMQVGKMLSEGATVDKALNMLGTTVKGLVQSEMVEGKFAPNAPATIKKKGSSTPLIDTGYMRQSINYVISNGEDE